MSKKVIIEADEDGNMYVAHAPEGVKVVTVDWGLITDPMNGYSGDDIRAIADQVEPERPDLSLNLRVHASQRDEGTA